MKDRAIKLCVAAGLAALGIAMLGGSQAVAQGIRDGMAVCGKVLIPSLFPFMVLCSFIALTNHGAVLSLPIRPLTKRIFKLPPELGAVVLLSLVGGYPVGAKMIATLLADGKISPETAQRMLCFCVNCGPSFLITAVGIGMFSSRELGIILFATQAASTLLIGCAVSLRAEMPKRIKTAAVSRKSSEAFVLAVSGASSAMIVMCAFAVLFSGLLAMLRESGASERIAGVLPLSPQVINAVLSGFFEVTAGCLGAAQVGGEAAVLLVSVCASFCGLSVIFQVMSCFKDTPVRFRPFVYARLAHMAVSGALAVALYRFFTPANMPAWLPDTPPPVLKSNGATLVISICLLAMCSILVLSTGRKEH